MVYDCIRCTRCFIRYDLRAPVGMYRKISIETTEKRSGIGSATIDSLDLVSVHKYRHM